MKPLPHAIAGGIALLTISAFWFSTLAVEFAGSPEWIALLKQAIPFGFLWLIPALAFTGLSGNILGRGRSGRMIAAKKKRMLLIATNGILVLIPTALFLATKARTGEFDAIFYAVQGLELIIGGVNIVLLGLNMRDGLKVRSARRCA